MEEIEVTNSMKYLWVNLDSRENWIKKQVSIKGEIIIG
jgi:hypothetical protein